MHLYKDIRLFQGRGLVWIKQITLRPFDIAQNKRGSIGAACQPFMIERAAYLHPIRDLIEFRQPCTGLLRAWIAVMGMDPGPRHAPGEADRVITLGTADIEHNGIGALDYLFDDGGQAMFITADPPCTASPFGRAHRIVHPLERTAKYLLPVRSNKRRFQQGRTPFRQVAQHGFKLASIRFTVKHGKDVTGDGFCQIAWLQGGPLSFRIDGFHIMNTQARLSLRNF